jgi:branched-chain amino acid transport system permease protein
MTASRVTSWQLLHGVPILLLAALPLMIGNTFYLHLAVLICLNAIFVLGLSIIARVGQLSFCHGAFIGIGAYAAVLAERSVALPFLAGVVIAAGVAGLLAATLGWIILRLRGVYFVLVTFAFGELVRLLLLDFPSVSGGANGITDIPVVTLLGVPLDTKAEFYVFALIVLVATLSLTAALLRSPIGRAFGAIEENLALARGVGISARHFQILAFTLGSTIAAAAGVLLAHYIGYISPESFGMQLSVNLIIMLVVGGRKSLIGPLLGALFLTPLPELLRNTLQLQYILFGAVLILVLRFLPGGLGGLVDRWGVRPASRAGKV